MREYVTKLNVLWAAGILLLAGGSYYVLHQMEARSACQTQYNTVFAEQASIRARLSAASDQAQSDFISGAGKLILAPPTTDKKVLDKRSKAFAKLFVDFDRVVDQVEKDRAANPLPVTPNC